MDILLEDLQDLEIYRKITDVCFFQAHVVFFFRKTTSKVILRDIQLTHDCMLIESPNEFQLIYKL